VGLIKEVRLIRMLHEGHVPFLDRDFLDVAMGCDAAQKMTSDGRTGKHAHRSAFE